MKIQQVQTNTTQPVFNGYVNKNVIKIINIAVDNTADSIIRKANQNREKINQADFLNIRERRDEVLQKLDIFMEKLHKKTSLNVDMFGDLVFENSKLGRQNRLLYMKAPYIPDDLDKLGMKQIDNINNFADTLLAMPNPDEIDKELFHSFAERKSQTAKNTSLLGKLNIWLTAKKLNRLAKEFGAEAGWYEKLDKIHCQTVIDKQRNQENIKIAKDILTK